MEDIGKTALTLKWEIAWFEAVVTTALSLYFQNESDHSSVYAHEPPNIDGDDSQYATLISNNDLGFEERLVVILALLPYIKPQSLDVFFNKESKPEQRIF